MINKIEVTNKKSGTISTEQVHKVEQVEEKNSSVKEILKEEIEVKGTITNKNIEKNTSNINISLSSPKSINKLALSQKSPESDSSSNELKIKKKKSYSPTQRLPSIESSNTILIPHNKSSLVTNKANYYIQHQQEQLRQLSRQLNKKKVVKNY